MRAIWHNDNHAICSLVFLMSCTHVRLNNHTPHNSLGISWSRGQTLDQKGKSGSGEGSGLSQKDRSITQLGR